MKLTFIFLTMLAIGCLGAPPPGYTLKFNATFKGYGGTANGWLPISEWGPISPYNMAAWWQPSLIAHTPYDGDFSDAVFTGPNDPSGNPSPFWQGWGQMVIEPYQDSSGAWHSGLVATVDQYGTGFSQAFGYWEISARLPTGSGVWPLFRLEDMLRIQMRNPTANEAEIDVFEFYGNNPPADNQAIHVWSPSGQDLMPAGNSNVYQVSSPTSKHHIFGCLVNIDFIHFYVDGVEAWKVPTPIEAAHPLYCMVAFALGAGYPINIAPRTRMWVDYIRCYAPPPLHTVTLAWDTVAPTTDPDTNPVGYHVHLGASSGNYAQSIDVGNVAQARIPGLGSGTTYYFAVTAYNVAGADSPPSNEISYQAP